MGRIVSYPVSAVAVTAVQDFFEVLSASGKPFYLHKFNIHQKTDYGDAAAEGLDYLIKRGIGNTSGSGGTTLAGSAAGKASTNDANAGPTVEFNNTTQAVAGGGSLTNLEAGCFNVQSGLDYLPVPEDRFLFLPGEMCVVSISAPADSLTMSGTITIEEL